MKAATAWVGLGANLGDSLATMARAVRALRGGAAIRVTGMSPVYRSSPVGLQAQPSFLNAAARVRTRLAPDALVRRLLVIERKLGRRRTVATRGGARVIDLDLLLWDDVIRRSRLATVPHPRLHRRRFALRPIVAVDPAAMHPVLGVPLRRLLARAPRSQRVRALPRSDQRRFRLLTAGRS
ncbi:MAG: 2-amino-4-hydroxy-6-hydroxymethyldihydropteridine diphosphokinase [Candidatus Coatesbacteria bacterium]